MNSAKSTPRLHAPPPGWSSDGHRIKAPLEYSRGPDKTWIYGALRVGNGKALTLTAPARNTVGYLALLEDIEGAYPTGDLSLITDNLASHKSGPIREWLATRPRIQQVFIPTKAGSAQPDRGVVAVVSTRGDFLGKTSAMPARLMRRGEWRRPN